MKSITKVAIGVVVLAGIGTVFGPTWTLGAYTAQEVGFPQEVIFQSTKAEKSDYNKAPAPLAAAVTGGPAATAAYKNVKVMTDVSAAEFMRTQYAITAWVAPQQGCAFCHAGTDYASDAKPTKAASRVMMQMVRSLNTDWSSHVAPAGVTCYTCHRGQPVPSGAWFPNEAMPPHPMSEPTENWQEIGDTVHKFFPDVGFSEYYLDNQPIRVQSDTIEPNGSISSWPEAKNIYEMMMQYSDAIGVNCGYCHNSRNWADWNQSTPYRWVGYDALRLVRAMNNQFMLDLARLIPQTRVLVNETRIPAIPVRMRGPQPGNALITCAVCHQGITKPLNGANMIGDYPGLGKLAPPGPIHGPESYKKAPDPIMPVFAN